jgi:hypothetical protein
MPIPSRTVAIEQRMDGALGRNLDPRESADQALANLCTPGAVLALDVQDADLRKSWIVRPGGRRLHMRDLRVCRTKQLR